MTTSKRITKADLLSAGWHCIGVRGIEVYTIPFRISAMLTFHQAAKILKQRGVDENGEMK